MVEGRKKNPQNVRVRVDILTELKSISLSLSVGTINAHSLKRIHTATLRDTGYERVENNDEKGVAVQFFLILCLTFLR